MDRGIKLPEQHRDFDRVHPLDVMTNLGLEVIQDRETQRQVRNVMPMGQEGEAILAELAIDSVVYHFNDKAIRHHEVEIEAKARDGSTVLRTVIESLIATYGPALQRWDYGKLATGKAIEELLNEGALEGLLDINNHLKPGAYDRIAGFLRPTGL